MKTLKDFRDERAAKQERIEEILEAAEKENRAFTTSEGKELRNLEADLAKLEGQIDAQKEKEEEIARRVAANRNGGNHGAIFTPRAAPSGRAKYANPLGMLARSAYSQKYAEERGVTSSSGAASIQNPSVTGEIIFQLSSGFNVGRTGVQIISPDNYTQWPVITAGPAAQWFAEGDTFTADTAMTIGTKKIDYSYVGFLVKASHFWLRDSAVDGEAMINEAILRALDEALMTAILSGDSANKQPDGFDNISSIQTVDAGQAVLDDYTERISAIKKLLAVDVALENISHVYGTTSWAQTQAFADSTGQPLMMPEGLKGITSVHSNAVLENYGAGTNETREYFFDRTNVRIALGDRWEITMVEKYADTMEVGFLVVAPVDIRVFHPTTVCIIENIATA
ncbi:MAG: phage major capsid protein [Phaeodactylibacter sp.]|nr:phage major capsid protein [Phaeodactylibacter sp.]